MRLYDYSQPIQSRKPYKLSEIPSSESLHLNIAHEVEAFDRALDGITVFDYNKETIAYCAGKLGLSVEQYQTLSTEDFKEMLKNAKQKIQALWVKISSYYKKNYAKISMYFMDLFKKYSKLTDDFRAIRNKNKIGISPSTQDLLIKHFGYLGNDFLNHMGHLSQHLISVVKDLSGSMFHDPLNLKESTSVTTQFGKYVKGLIEKQGNIDGQVLCITYCCNNKVRYIYNGKPLEEDTTSTEDEKQDVKPSKSKVDPSKILHYGEAQLESTSRAKEEFIDINFAPVLQLAKDNDALRDKVKDFSKAIQDLESKCSSYISSSSNAGVEEFRNAFLMSTKLTMDSTYNILDNLKAITNCLKAIRDDAVNTSFYAYYLYVAMVEKSKNIPLPGVSIPASGNIEIVEDGDKTFIDLNSNWDTVIEQTGLVGGLALINYKFEDEQDQASEDEDTETIQNGNIIFLDRQMRGYKDDPNFLKGSGMTLDFLYYHEEGHVVTGQDEIPLKNRGEMQDVDQRYFSHFTENAADAYACKKTGVSVSQVADWRAKMGNKLIADNKEQFIKNVERFKGDVSTWKFENGKPSK